MGPGPQRPKYFTTKVARNQETENEVGARLRRPAGAGAAEAVPSRFAFARPRRGPSTHARAEARSQRRRRSCGSRGSARSSHAPLAASHGKRLRRRKGLRRDGADGPGPRRRGTRSHPLPGESRAPGSASPAAGTSRGARRAGCCDSTAPPAARRPHPSLCQVTARAIGPGPATPTAPARRLLALIGRRAPPASPAQLPAWAQAVAVLEGLGAHGGADLRQQPAGLRWERRPARRTQTPARPARPGGGGRGGAAAAGLLQGDHGGPARFLSGRPARSRLPAGNGPTCCHLTRTQEPPGSRSPPPPPQVSAL